MEIEGIKGRQIKKGIWAFHIPQFEKNSYVINPKWLAFRKHFIGASEVSIITGHDDSGYASPARLFYSKIGFQFMDSVNEFAYWGHQGEDNIARTWSYYDATTEDGYLHNASSGNVIRKYTKPSYYIVNEEYPWLMASLDFLVNKNQFCPLLGETLDYNYPLETKTIASFVADKYEMGLPPKYLIQCTTQMIVWGCDYSELAALIGGNKFEVFPFTKSEKIASMILADTYEF